MNSASLKTVLSLLLAQSALLLSLAAVVVCGPALAQTRVPPDAATTGQKATFVENLVTRSVSAQHIEQSGDQAARDKLDQARRLVDDAKADLGKGAIEAANDKLDQALAMVNTEIRRLSGTEVKNAHERDVYTRRLKAVKAFLSAYERVAESGASRAAADQATTIRGLIDEAERKASSGQYQEATETLNIAYSEARGDIRQLRQGQTLTRSLNFATVEEAYDYELGRNQSHFLLLQFAFSESKPKGSIAGRVEENRSAAERLRADAEKRAASGEHAEAIEMLNESTELLLKAIRMSGIFIPG